GYDAHRFKAGRPCILCGVQVPSEFGPDGHSDADVAVHALMDARLGAAALGDIGKLFPDQDDRWLGADSVEMLRQVMALLADHGYTFGNADITIVAQKPKLAPYIDAMRTRLAQVMETDIANISVKATTEEKMGFTGDGTGISAHAVVLLV
ncbi:MAG: 2-C-methyl-D-erythritol 2,4-cyclodiphosphate synthase, partial [Oscillospiraceae bacterium]|nr:2-C-methyl-D-erythritol 2,4-cyclodiphosphate synthase [Oscillospiraceae bacterium]